MSQIQAARRAVALEELAVLDTPEEQAFDDIVFIASRTYNVPIALIITSGKPLPPRTTMPAETVFFPKPYRQDRVIASLHQLAA